MASHCCVAAVVAVSAADFAATDTEDTEDTRSEDMDVIRDGGNQRRPGLDRAPSCGR